MGIDNWQWTDITPDSWAELKDLWLDMISSRPGVFLETLSDLEAMTEAEWRVRVESLVGADSFAQAIRADGADDADSPSWLGFVTAYVDELSRERNVFVTNIHVRNGSRLEGVLIEAVLAWAAQSFAEAVIVEVRDDHRDVVARYLSHGFCRTGAARLCECDDRHYELELARPLDGGGLADIRWRAVARSEPLPA